MALRENLNANFKQLQEENKVNNAYLTGQISTEKKMFEQIKEMKTSTFDRSKFSIVGNPTIADDGIASGFSVNNWIEFKNGLSNLMSSYKFTTKFNILSTPNAENTLFGLNSPDTLYGVNIRLSIKNDGYLSFYFGNYLGSSVQLDLGVYYVVECGQLYNGNAFLCYKKIEDTNWIEEITGTGTLPNVTSIHNATIGNSPHANNEYFNGSIDLSQFSIEVDGKEVFNGNKTGIDQIKNDDYTVVGSPVISDDGIVSGFSGSNYITKKISLNENSIIQGAFTTPNDLSSIPNDLLIFSINNDELALGLHAIGLVFWYVGTSTWINVIPISDLLTNNTYNFRIEKDKITVDNVVKNISTPTFESTDIYLGKPRSSEHIGFSGSIDLNSIKIYSDGNLLYQPTLRIPYTKSKTGSKIVDSVYRDRVQDMYEQFGYANYYTLSDIDFTLPMGEVYGMIASAKKGGGSSEASWGDITGNIDNQVDLKNKLDSKQPVGDYATNSTVSSIDMHLNNEITRVEVYANAVDRRVARVDQQIYEIVSGGIVKKVNDISPDTYGNVTLSIPSAVTETTVSGWGFTKNTGTVTKVNNTSPDANGNVTISIPSSSDFVKTSGDQTIAGVKTFSSTISGNVSGSSGSCTGNSATATKATQDSSGNTINTTYQRQYYSRYSVSTYASSNPYIKLATFSISNTTNNDLSCLFWVEAHGASTSKNYALVKLSARWSGTAYTGTKFEIVEKYGDDTSCFDSLVWAYKYTTASSKGSITGEVWMKTTTNSYWTYYFRPTECNEFGDYSMTPVKANTTNWTYYDKAGTSTAIASTAITSDFTQVKVVDKISMLSNPYSLLDSKHSELNITNTSWLKSSGQWNSGDIYVDAYNKVVSIGKPSTGSYTDYDFVYNTSNKTFKLPLKTKKSFVIEEGEENGIKYRIWNDGYCEQFGENTENTTGAVTINLPKTYKNTSYEITSSTYHITTPVDLAYSMTVGEKQASSFKFYRRSTGNTGYNIMWQANGYLASDQYTPQNLYYYVGDTVQNATLIDVAQVTSALAGKEDIDNWVYWTNGTDNYIYNKRNGYCKQWSFHPAGSGAITVALIKKYKDTNYFISCPSVSGTGTSQTCGLYWNSKTVSGFKYVAAGVAPYCWMTEGYLAEGEY